MALVSLFSSNSVPMRCEQILALELRNRIGWITNLAEKVLGLYSTYFRQESLADEFIALGWRFVETGEATAAQINELLERYYPLIDEDAVGLQNEYFRAIRVAPRILLERLEQNCRHALDFIESTSLALVIRLHWASKTISAPGETDIYSDRIISAFYNYTSATLTVANSNKLYCGAFDHIPLRLPRPESNSMPRAEDTIPRHERCELLLPAGVECEPE